jgi:hypothetical protein
MEKFKILQLQVLVPKEKVDHGGEATSILHTSPHLTYFPTIFYNLVFAKSLHEALLAVLLGRNRYTPVPRR